MLKHQLPAFLFVINNLLFYVNWLKFPTRVNKRYLIYYILKLWVTFYSVLNFCGHQKKKCDMDMTFVPFREHCRRVAPRLGRYCSIDIPDNLSMKQCNPTTSELVCLFSVFSMSLRVCSLGWRDIRLSS